jgi:hypothetical protein
MNPRPAVLARLAAAIAASIAVLALTGCGSGASQPRVASVAEQGSSSGSGSTAPPADVVTQYVEGQRALAKCLRSHGFEVSDPDSRGRLEFGRPPGGSKADPKAMAGWKACGHLSRPVPAGLEDPLPPRTPEEIEAARRYARCMRENGAPDFPGPGPSGWFERGEWNQATPGARRASKVCGPIIGEPAHPGPARG